MIPAQSSLVAVIDFSGGTQYGPSAVALYDACRRRGYESFIVRHDEEVVFPHHDTGPPPTLSYIILSGDPPRSVSSSTVELVSLSDWVTNSSVPVLGFGYGATIIAHHRGSTLEPRHETPSLHAVSELNQDIQSHHQHILHRSHCIKHLGATLRCVAVVQGEEVVAFTDHGRYQGYQYASGAEECETNVGGLLSNFLTGPNRSTNHQV